MNNLSFPKIAVLLAAYNGENFLNKQIETILCQKKVNVSIFISLDKSSDNSKKIISDISKREDNVNLISTDIRFGSASKNFMHLVNEVNLEQFEFVSFADQDDEWFENKLYNAVSSLNSSNKMAYSGNTYSFNLKTKYKKLIKKNDPPKEWDFLFESASAGCTYVLRKEVVVDLKKNIKLKWNDLKNINHFDWYVYAFTRSKNIDWYFDERPLMNNIQHSNNDLGSNVGVQAYLKRFKMLTSKYWFRQSVLLTSILEIQNQKFCKNYIQLNRKSFLYLAFKTKQCRRKTLDQIVFFTVCVILTIFN